MNENTDIPDLARRVLGADKVGRDLNNAASWDAVDLVLENAPVLARTVLRMEALAERLERESGIGRDLGDYPNESGAMAARLRAVLKGDTA